ncbi:MAG: SpoIIE family protein phosphatase [Turneriella sp.]
MARLLPLQQEPWYMRRVKQSIINALKEWVLLPPKQTPLKLQRHFISSNTIFVLAFGIHFAFIFFFLVFGVPEMMWFNIASCAWFVGTIYLNRKLYLFTALHLCFFEVLAHAMACVHFFGWESGYQYYAILLPTGIFLLPPGKTWLKFFTIITGCAIFAGGFYYSLSHPPVYKWGSPFLEVINISNIIFAALFQGGFAYYFTWAASKAEQSLEDEHAAQSAFFQNISHELRTPLTLILGPADSALRRKAHLNNDELEMVVSNANRLSQLVNRLLDLQKVTAGKMVLNLEPRDLAAYVKATGEAFKPYAESRQIRLVVEVPGTPVAVEYDEQEIDKCLYNLLSNAFKFTPRGKSITLVLQAVDGWAEVAVRDEGVGIDAEQQKRLFSRFGISRASLTREQEGTGLGLALVKELVELHKGYVGVESEVNRGSRFFFRLPLSDKTELLQSTTLQPRVPEAAAKRPADTAQAAQNGARILVVEANPDLRSYIGAILQRAGHHVSFAENGDEGRVKFSETAPDVVITDLMMPKVSGLGLIQYIRTESQMPSVPVILLTAKASVETRQEVIQHGANHFLSKPFRDSELLDVLHNVLQLKAPERRLTKERAEAMALQKKLLPASIPQIFGFQMAVTFRPAEGIAGDLYDFFPLADGRLGVLIADVSGHGIAAGMIGSMAKLALGLPGAPLGEPARLLQFINGILTERTASYFLTAIYLVVNPSTGEVILARAGHPPLYWLQNGNISALKPAGTALGWDKEAGWIEQGLTMMKGDRLILVTDGIIETTGYTGALRDEEEFRKLLRENSGVNLAEFGEALMQSASKIAGRGTFDDDITIIAIERTT